MVTLEAHTRSDSMSPSRATDGDTNSTPVSIRESLECGGGVRGEDADGGGKVNDVDVDEAHLVKKEIVYESE